jgi:ribokinase
MSPRVVVLGSANLDHTFAVPQLPGPGETVLATGSERHVGGKGLNQATAARRAGCPTAFIGAVGRDHQGQELARWLEAEDIETERLRYLAESSGLATILVDPAGENVIVVSPGANGHVSLSPADAAVIAGASLLVMQCEVPQDVLVEAASIATDHSTRVLLNAAPAHGLAPALLDRVDILVVNGHEASTLIGDVSDPSKTLSMIVPDAVVTHGSQGVSWAGVSGAGALAAHKVPVIDTTGAGDTFVGYLAAGLADGMGWVASLERATVASALAIQRPGGAVSIPTIGDVASSALLTGPA